MKLLYFSPMGIGILFIYWLFCKGCDHYNSELDSGKIDKEEAGKYKEEFGKGVILLSLFWILLSFFMAAICIATD